MSDETAAKKATIMITGLKLESEPIEVNTSEVDPAWLFTDAAGNKQRWAKDSEGAWCLPTLERRVIPVMTWDECSEEWRPDTIVQYYAPDTGEYVNPGMRHVSQFVQGRIEASVEFESNAIPPEGSVRFDECVFPMQYGKVVNDLGAWTFFVKEYRPIGPGKWAGTGVCVGAPPKAGEARREDLG